MSRVPQMNFQYLHTEKIGYGNHGIETHKALEAIGVDVYDGLPGSPDLDIDNKKSKICRDVLYLTIPSHVPGWWEGQRKHLFTMWETDTLPPSLRDNLHTFDTILVPSQTCVELYSKYHDNVHYVPLGVNGTRWAYRERRKPDVFFTFMVAGSGMRKGNDLVFRAFNELFPNGQAPSPELPIPRLIMKNPKGDEVYRGENIEILSGFMPAEEETELYASIHCYVQPSRGEGWGMQPLQAMAQGCPTILTDAHGHAPFARYGIPIPAGKSKADYMQLFGESGDWWEPDYEQLKRHMLDVYMNYEYHQAYAALQSQVVRDLFTWEKSAEAIVEAIGGRAALEERWRKGTIWPGQWTEPEQKKFRVRTNRNWKADIAGTVYLFAKGADYWVPADTKRILFETNVLDPDCIDDDEGLSPQQLDKREEYIANATICPLCGSQFRDDDPDEEEDP